MARAQLRYVVTDEAGNVIANARVYVYETGTVTALTDLYAAPNGGAAIGSSSLVSDAKGEILGYVNTPRYVKLAVTDNAGAAYYPTNAATTLTFPAFDVDPIALYEDPTEEQQEDADFTTHVGLLHPTSAAELPFSHAGFSATNTEDAIVEGAGGGTPLTGLTAATTLNDGDLLLITQDPTGTPLSKSITAGLLRSLLDSPALAPAAALAETIPRSGGGFNANLTTGLATGTLRLCAIKLYQGQEITSISFLSGSQAAAGSSHLWFALYDASRSKLAVTADDTAASPWGSNTVKTMALSPSSYVVSATGLYYLGICIVATTIPTFHGASADTILNGIPPILVGNTTDVGLTDPASAPLTAGLITASNNRAYGYVS